ncbi:MAG: hypothetical protein QM752_06755 [Gammaproteobacteria bacterium]
MQKPETVQAGAILAHFLSCMPDLTEQLTQSLQAALVLDGLSGDGISQLEATSLISEYQAQAKKCMESLIGQSSSRDMVILR